MSGTDYEDYTAATRGTATDRAEYTANNEAETQTIGESLGRHAAPGDILCLIGDLGAGKTTLTQGIGKGLGIRESEVSSPTFSLIAEHRGGRIPLYHFDVYRLRSADDLHDLGFEDYVREPDGVVVIEWANIVMEAVPEDSLVVELRPQDTPDSRSIRFTATGPNAARLLEAIR
jgi:tRNA threonylcarbamoyladenosine biosynthesis protein TsaE